MDDEKTTFFKAAVWDLPTRLFHWLLAISVSLGWYFGNFRGFSTIDWHFYLGYTTISLLVFRLIWGFIGPPSARFLSFFPTPKRTWIYVKSLPHREPSGLAGHSPLGGLSVIVLLALLIIQTTTGLFAEDDSLFASGPLSELADPRWVLYANDIHHKVSRLLLFFIGLHLAAVVFYHVWKRENLIGAMITGKKLLRKQEK